MLLNLVKLRFKAILYNFSTAVRGKGRAARIAFSLLMVYAFGTIAVSMGVLFYQLAAPLNAMGYDWLLFALAGLMAMAFALFSSTLGSKNQLYNAKDNELLLAMPIKPAYILAARLIGLSFTDYLVGGIILLPAYVGRTMALGFDFLALLRFIPLFVMFPMLPVALGSFFGWLLSLAEKRVRNKNLVTMVLSLALMAAYFLLIDNASEAIAYLQESGAEMAASLAPILPVYSFGMAAAGDPLHMLIFAALSLGSIGLAAALLGRSFNKIALAPTHTRRQETGSLSHRRRSMGWALLHKELRRFTSSPGYMLNAGMGLIMMPIAAAALASQLGQLTMAFELMGLEGLTLPAAAAWVMALICSMTFISAASVSLEGKNLWLLRSLPVDSGLILLSKARLHTLVCLPFCLVSSVICIVVLKAEAWLWPALILIPMAQSALCGLMGVAVNLLFPKLDWTNETQVVKQGMSTLAAMLLGAVSAAAPAVLYMALLRPVMSADSALYLWLVLQALACLVLRGYLKRGGARRFEALSA